ncbi:unnamed protein product [Moneuplotes crassus]|uniref:Uncharacterized protein n=1 Tax=Euplotes crassus TaxID=5936 RepID=A0AAD1XFF8_EUPCR|nr:unnamed protein product [Moneuplotes crassus]CAI2369892.1 unnamed protein product [Moneuplotes crassus]
MGSCGCIEERQPPKKVTDFKRGKEENGKSASKINYKNAQDGDIDYTQLEARDRASCSRRRRLGKVKRTSEPPGFVNCMVTGFVNGRAGQAGMRTSCPVN